jgi:CHAT domain-containing protein/tetratricopeptide (TPR) repeat protein
MVNAQNLKLLKVNSMKKARFLITLIPAIAIGILSLSSAAPTLRENHIGGAAQTLTVTVVLEPGKTLERQIKGSQLHHYHITTGSGQYLNVVLDQRGIDVKIKLFDPKGEQIGEMDWQGKQGRESLWALADKAGDYRLEVHPNDKQAAEGAYTIKIEKIASWQDAPPADKDRVTAHQLNWEAGKLKDAGTAESQKQAIEKYQQALLLWRSIKDEAGAGHSLGEIGYLYSRVSQPQKSLEHYLPALEIWRRLENRRYEAEILDNIGVAYYRLNETRKGVGYLERGAQISREIGDRFLLGLSLNSLGTLYDALYERKKSLDCYFEAAEIYKSLENPRWEAAALDNVGLTYALLGEPQQALETLDKALVLRRVAKDFRGEGYTLQHIGYVFEYLGEVDKAIAYYSQALPLWQKTGDPFGVAASTCKLGLLYQRAGDLNKSLEEYHQALPLARQARNKNLEAQVLAGLGVVYLKLGNTKEARNYLDQALVIQREIEERQGEAYSIFNVGECYLAQHETPKALEQYQAALQINRAIGNRVSEAMALYRIADVKRNQGNFAEARKDIESAVTIIESLRRKIVANELRTSYFARSQTYYELYIDLLMQMHQLEPSAGHDSVALQASERARARSLLDLLTESLVDIRQGVDAGLLELRRTLQQQVNSKAEQLTRLLSLKHTQAQETAVKGEVEAALAQYQEVEAKIRASSPRYASLTQPQPLGVREIQRQVVDKDTLLLEFALGEKRSYLWAVSTTEVNSYELPARAELENRARQVYDLLTARNLFVKFEAPDERQARIAKAEAEYYRVAGSLSQMLLGPIAAKLPGKRLLIVGDGALQYLPFAALPTPAKGEARNKGQRPGNSYHPLIIDHEVVSLPSATVLGVLRRELAGRAPAPKTVAVLADPVFNKNDERVTSANSLVKSVSGRAKSDEARVEVLESELVKSIRDVGIADSWELARLPSTRREAEAILDLTAEAEHFKALDFDANRAAATKPELSQYRIVHFATHGLLNSTHPGLSGLILSLVDREGHEQNGFLPAHEIFNLKLPAELVVLSGCQTGLGKEVKGEGLLGLTRGFMYAGAARVVVSLWEINDQSTAELMKHFYQGMLGAARLRSAAALRSAQISLLKTKRWHSPYYWAAFTLQGEPK